MAVQRLQPHIVLVNFDRIFGVCSVYFSSFRRTPPRLQSFGRTPPRLAMRPSHLRLGMQTLPAARAGGVTRLHTLHNSSEPAKFSVSHVQVSWMPMGLDWTSAFRACPSVAEYILVSVTCRRTSHFLRF